MSSFCLREIDLLLSYILYSPTTFFLVAHLKGANIFAGSIQREHCSKL